MFDIKTNEGTISASTEVAFQPIIKKAFETIANEDFVNLDQYINHINKIIQPEILNLSQRKINQIYFLSGYYYKLFLEKNNVTIIEEKIE